MKLPFTKSAPTPQAPRPQRPWVQIPAARSSAPVLKIRLAVVVGLLSLAVVSALFSGFATLTRPEPEIPEPAPVAQARGFAEQVARSWLSGQPTPLAVAEGVDAWFGRKPNEEAVAFDAATVAWDSFEVLEPLPGRVLEVHRFLLSGEYPRFVVVTVELTDNGPVLAAAPSLEPAPIAAAEVIRFDYSDHDNAKTPTEEIRHAVTEWLAAYAADDRPRLAELTGDLEGRTYAGLGGFTVERGEAVTALPIPNQDRWLVRARAVLVDKNGFRALNEWDLLVTQPETANPRIAAWGPAGSGGYLEPYQNGIVAVAAPVEDPAPTGGGTDDGAGGSSGTGEGRSEVPGSPDAGEG